MSGMRPFRPILDRLHQAGLRPTRQRMALAKLMFEGRDCHVTAESLHAQAITHRVRVSLATVYNTLHQFTSAGLLREIVIDAARSYFDTNTSDHHHFYWEGTGLLEDIPSDQIIMEKLPSPPPGTTIKRIDVVIRLAGCTK
ncbi:MAG: iron response transcriptional regulator IrrA [Rhodospirillales bacterium]|jgi:Fur family iron response transcriptional regulator